MNEEDATRPRRCGVEGEDRRQSNEKETDPKQQSNEKETDKPPDTAAGERRVHLTALNSGRAAGTSVTGRVLVTPSQHGDFVCLASSTLA